MNGRIGRVRHDLARLTSAQKPAVGTAAYARYVNRPAGRFAAAWSHSFGLTPNMATAISGTLSAAGIALLAVGRPTLWSGALVAVLLAAGYVMDSVDGQLARLAGGGSVRGEWLDHTVDAFKTNSLHLAVAISWFRFPPFESDRTLLIPVGYTVVQSVTYFGFILMPFLRRSAAAPRPRDDLVEGRWRRWLILPTDYGFLCWTFVLLGAQQTFAVVYSVLFALSSAMLALALRKWWTELGELDRARSSL